MAAALSLYKPEEAKGIIEAMSKLKYIYELKWPPCKDDLSIMHLVRQLVHLIKDVRDSEALIRIIPVQLR
jgi:hypothetical protein